MPLEIIRIPALSDNYVWLARDQAQGRVAVVDPAEAEPVAAELARRGWRLDAILNTHHHGDHVGGNRALVAAFGCAVVGPAADRARIPHLTIPLAEGESWMLGATRLETFDVSGHTMGHCAYLAREAAALPDPDDGLGPGPALFCGDALFALGCGRMFEGDPETMWGSLAKLRALPPLSVVHCAHEYTLANARWAVTADPDNAALAARAEAVARLRAAGRATVPSRLAAEIATNPFLRADDPALARGAAAAESFARLRRDKDAFRG